MPEDDPSELFDVCDMRGDPLGVTKPRALVHRDGDWHRSIHIWVVLAGRAPTAVLFQRRALTKDTHPGKVDVAVAGHLRAGETVADALREAEEEIGLVVALRDLTRLGRRRRVDACDGHIDRELQEIFFVTTDRTLPSFQPEPLEVASLLTVPLTEAIAFARRETRDVTAHEALPGSDAREVVLFRSELLPDPDGYFVVALTSIVHHINGDPLAEWILGDGSSS